MTQTIVFDRKAVYMQRCADFVRAGYWHWSSGEVRPERARALVKKFARLYGTDKTRHQRAYSKAHGEGVAVLLLYAPYQGTSAPTTACNELHTAAVLPDDKKEGAGNDTPARHAVTSSLDSAGKGPDTFPAMPSAVLIAPHAVGSQPHPRLHWMLLVTPGVNPAHQLEHLRNANEAAGRISVTGYELVQLPRVGQVKAAWTWRMEEATYKGWRLRLIAAARRRLTLLNTETAQLTRTPGFAGCRAQVKKLVQLAAGEWRRQHDNAEPLAVPRVPYLQRLPNGGTSLTNWLRRYTRLTSCVANTGVDAPATES